MRYLKTLLVAMLALVGMVSYAQSWTADEIGEGYYLLYNLMRCLKIGGIGSVELHFDTQRGYLVTCSLRGFVEFKIGERYIGTLAGICQSYLFAYSTSCTRDKGCFIL